MTSGVDLRAVKDCVLVGEVVNMATRGDKERDEGG
jgi:hypothetical protein